MWRKFLLFLCAFFACRRNPQVGIEIVVPKEVKDTASWFEVGAYRKVSCKTAERFSAAGLPAFGDSAKLAWSRNEPAPAFGDLEKGYYAFVAIAKDDRCGVVGRGCIELEVSSGDPLSINMEAVEGQAGTCGEEASCVLGTCVPKTTGKSCSMAYVGGGPLAAPPITSNGRDRPAVIAALSPAIVATESGFVASYGEYSLSAGGRDAGADNATPVTLDFTAHYITKTGGTEVVRSLTDGVCPTTENEGLGLGYGGNGKALIFLARQRCAPAEQVGTGLDVFATQLPDTAQALATLGVFSGVTHMSLARGVAPRGQGLWVGYVRAKSPIVLPVDIAGDTVTAGTTVTFDTALTGKTLEVRLASSEKVAAVAIARESGTILDGGTSGPETWVHTAATGAAFALKTKVPVLHSLAVLDTTVFTTSTDATGTVAIGSIDASGTGVTTIGSVGKISGAEPSTFADLAAVKYANGQTRLFTVFSSAKTAGADGSPSDLVIAAIDPKGAPNAEIRVAPPFPHVLSPSGLRNGRVAIAASEKRVAIIWHHAKSLDRNEPLGGYAVFACEP